MDNRTIEEVRSNETKLIKEIEILEEENQELKEIIDKTITTLVNIDGNLAYGKESDKICNLIDTLRLVK